MNREQPTIKEIASELPEALKYGWEEFVVKEFKKTAAEVNKELESFGHAILFLTGGYKQPELLH